MGGALVKSWVQLIDAIPGRHNMGVRQIGKIWGAGSDDIFWFDSRAMAFAHIEEPISCEMDDKIPGLSFYSTVSFIILDEVSEKAEFLFTCKNPGFEPLDFGERCIAQLIGTLRDREVA